MTNQQVHSLDLLAGVRIVSLAVNIPGPLTAARLTQLGARVTAVLPPSGDPLQIYLPQWFDDLHVDQEVVTLDLKSPEGIAELDSLLTQADILITASRPSALARLGMDSHSVSVKHPRLCHIAIVGESGERADSPGHDLTYQAINGLVNPPAMPTTLIADMAGSERATWPNHTAEVSPNLVVDLVVASAFTGFMKPKTVGSPSRRSSPTLRNELSANSKLTEASKVSQKSLQRRLHNSGNTGPEKKMYH